MTLDVCQSCRGSCTCYGKQRRGFAHISGRGHGVRQLRCVSARLMSIKPASTIVLPSACLLPLMIMKSMIVGRWMHADQPGADASTCHEGTAQWSSCAALCLPERHNPHSEGTLQPACKYPPQVLCRISWIWLPSLLCRCIVTAA